MHRWILALLLSALWTIDCRAFSAEISSLPGGHLQLGGQLLTFEDSSSLLTYEQVRDLPDSAFMPPQGKVPNFGFSNAVYWARVELSSSRDTKVPVILEYGYTSADLVDFYLSSPSGKLEVLKTGDTRPSSSYPIIYRMPAWPVDLEPGRSVLHVRIQSQGSIQFPLQIYEPRSFEFKRAGESAFLGAMYGIIAGLLFYNFGLFIFSRSPLVLIYCAFSASGLISKPLLHGFTNTLFYGYDLSWWNNTALMMSSIFVSSFGTVFTYIFLDVKKTNRWLIGSFGACLAFNVIRVGVTLVSYNLAVKFMVISVVLNMPLILWAALWQIYHGHKLAKLFLLAWASLLFGGVLHSLTLAGYVPNMLLTEFGWTVGIVAENVLLSLALSFKLRNELSQALRENKKINQQLIKKSVSDSFFSQYIPRAAHTFERNPGISRSRSRRSLRNDFGSGCAPN